MLSIFIHEGRPTTTKLTLVDLPSSIDHSTFHECSKGILCLAPTFHQSPLKRPVVIISYSLRLGRKSTLPSIYYSLEDRKGIHTEEINLLNFKEWHDLPSWYPVFQLPYQIDAKVTCTGFYVYIEIIHTAPIRWHWRHKLHQGLLKSRTTRVFIYKSIG